MTTWDIYFPLFSLTSYAVNLANTLGNIECDIFWPIFVRQVRSPLPSSRREQRATQGKGTEVQTYLRNPSTPKFNTGTASHQKIKDQLNHRLKALNLSHKKPTLDV